MSASQDRDVAFNLLPIGGFVRIFGEDSKEAQESGDFERSFVAKSPIQQSLVLIAGVTMNIIFAWFLFVLVYAIGVPTVVNEADASPDARLVIAEVLPESPAHLAGIPRGAEVIGLEAGEEFDQILKNGCSLVVRQKEESFIEEKHDLGSLMKVVYEQKYEVE